MEDAALGFEFGVFAGLRRGLFDLAALEAPEVGEPQFLLLVALEILQLRAAGAPTCIGRADLLEEVGGSGEGVQNLELRIGREEPLLVVLAVDIAEVLRQLAEQGGGHGTAACEGARLAASQDFAFDQQFAVLDLDAGGLQNRACGGRAGSFEDARNSGALGAGANHFRRGTAAEQQAQGVHDDGFAAACLPREQVEAAVKAHAQPLDDGIVLNYQLDKHSMELYAFPAAGVWVRVCMIGI